MADPRIFLAELDGYDPDTDTVITQRFCSGRGYQDGEDWYEPRILQPATFSRTINTAELGGRLGVSYGELTLVSIDGGVDYLADDYFDGRELRLYVGKQSFTRERFVMILKAQIAAVAVERERVSVRLRDRAVTLDKPFSTTKYLGNNTLPDGLEGTEDDIKDQMKPAIFGRVALMNPVMVNTSKLIYQFNNGVGFLANVFDGGSYLTRLQDYADLTELEQETDPLLEASAINCFRQYTPGGYFRIKYAPFGQISVSAAEAWTYQTCTAASILSRIIEQAAINRPGTQQPQGAPDWHHLDLQELDSLNAASLGVVVQPDETVSSLLDRVCASVGAFWGFDALGNLRVVRFDEPSATADMEVTVNDMLTAEREPEAQVPYWRVTVRCDHNDSVQDKTSLAGIVTADRAAWLSNEWRNQQAEDTDIQATRLLAEEVTYESLINGVSSAKAEAERRLALFSVRRDVATITLPEPAYFGEALDLGKTIKVTAPRLGYQSGRNMTVIGITLDYAENRADVTLWG